MYLSEILEQLTIGEVSQLNMGGAKTGGVLPQDYPKVIPHINLALTEIYKRFPLKTNDVVVQQYDEIQLYYLRSKYAQTNIASVEPIKYIEDTAYHPFEDDVLRIEKIIDEAGQELYLNQEDDEWEENALRPNAQTTFSVYTPEFDTVQIPYPDSSNQFIVHYRAAHSKLSTAIDQDPSTIEVHVPLALLEGLLLYVGGRVNLNRGTELSLAEGQTFMTKFEHSIKTVENLNLRPTVDTTNRKLDRNGWV